MAVKPLTHPAAHTTPPRLQSTRRGRTQPATLDTQPGQVRPSAGASKGAQNWWIGSISGP